MITVANFFDVMRNAIKTNNGLLSDSELIKVLEFEMLFPNGKILRLYAETVKDNQRVVSAVKDNLRYAFVLRGNQILRCVECIKINNKWSVNKKIWGYKTLNNETPIITDTSYDAEKDFNRSRPYTKKAKQPIKGQMTIEDLLKDSVVCSPALELTGSIHIGLDDSAIVEPYLSGCISAPVDDEDPLAGF